MARKTDHLTKALKDIVEPGLTAEGFQPRGTRGFIRRRGDLVDAIGLQVTQWGDKSFYVHHHIGNLVSPHFDPDGYRVGHRTDQDPASGASWEASTPQEAERSALALLAFAQSTLLPWFAGVRGLGGYVVEYIANPNNPVNNLDLATALAALGHTQRAWWIGHDIAADDSEDAGHRADAAALRDAVEPGADSARAYLGGLRARNIALHRIPESATAWPGTTC